MGSPGARGVGPADTLTWAQGHRTGTSDFQNPERIHFYRVKPRGGDA